LDGLFDDVQVGHRGTHKQDAGSVIEEERLLISSGARLSLAAQAAQATATKTATTATTDAADLTRNKRGREINTRRLEKLPDEDLDITHDVLPGHTEQTESALARTTKTLPASATALAATKATATATTLATALAALLAAQR
jgi:hypothetical protein